MGPYRKSARTRPQRELTDLGPYRKSARPKEKYSVWHGILPILIFISQFPVYVLIGHCMSTYGRTTKSCFKRENYHQDVRTKPVSSCENRNNENKPLVP